MEHEYHSRVPVLPTECVYTVSTPTEGVLEMDHVAISQSWVAVLRKPYDSATSELRSFKRTKTGICEEEKMETIKTT